MTFEYSIKKSVVIPVYNRYSAPFSVAGVLVALLVMTVSVAWNFPSKAFADEAATTTPTAMDVVDPAPVATPDATPVISTPATSTVDVLSDWVSKGEGDVGISFLNSSDEQYP